MIPLTIRLLGAPEVRYGKRPLSFRTRKVLALLIYLAVEKGMHSRESLMALLWPETETKKAAVTLRGTLSRLRRALAPVGDILVTEPGKVGLDFEYAIDLDLDWLAAAVTPDKSPDDLATVLEIDRGEFLAGFSLPDAPQFDTWAAIERQTWQRLVETVYERLTRTQLEMGNGPAAVATAVRWLARAPLNETAYRRLMTAQALTGDRTAALTTFAQCQTVLKTELDIAPSRETAVLAERIKDFRFRSADFGMAGTDATIRSRQSQMPFVGRAEEHSRLTAALRETGTAGARVVTVIGAGGVGKTRLVQTFLAWAALDIPNVDIWQGRAFEMGGRLPYEPVIEALRLRLEQENAPEDLLEDVWLAELSQLMPELRGRYPDLPPPMTGDANFVRSRLFAAVATLGSVLAARQPAIFVLDDMQWADADSLDLVHYAARRWAESGAPILLLLTVRQENFAADNTLREWLSRLDRDVPLTRLLLDSLSGTAVKELVDRLGSARHGAETSLPTKTARAVPGTSGQAFADWLWAETNGLPFFIEALLQMLIEQGVLTETENGYEFAAALQHVQSAGHVPLPPGVRDVILARLEQLAEPESVLLLAAAVLGRECSFHRLCQVADMNEVAGLPALEALLNGRLLTENGTARRPYTLAHDHIRQVVYNTSMEARRRVLHRRALIDLEAAGASAAECAYHAAASLLDEPTFRFSLVAGDEAMAAHALQECLAHYNRALEAAQMMGLETTTLTKGSGQAIPTESVCRLYENRGRALELNYQYDDAQANYQEMRELAESRSDPALKLAALIAQGIIHATYTSLFNPTTARELGSEALALARKLSNRAAEAKALWCLMMAEFFGGGERQKILAYGEEALAIAQELELKELMGYIFTNLAWTYFNAEQIDAALKANSDARAAHLAVGNLPMVADSDTIKTFIYRHTGRFDALLAMGPAALQFSQSIKNDVNQWSVLLNMARAYCFQGQIGLAIANIEATKAISEPVDELQYETGYFSEIIPIYLLGGALEQAEACADKVYARRESFVPIFQTFNFVHIARAKIARRKLKEAEAVLEQAFNGLGKEPPFITIAPLYVADGRLQLALGNPHSTLERMADLIQRLHTVGSRAYLAEAYWLQGKAWLTLAKIEQARESLIAAKVVAEENSERTILWQILASLADLEKTHGNATEAEKLRKQAQEIVTYIADHAGSDELRTSFLNRSDVQGLDKYIPRKPANNAFI